ncbi:MAG TPA: uroporphyrinogen-III C-methyltransferase [Desulfobacteraceae bacterium]|nr:uroporphyrinogen-III C-methyltransferase [Desulfobacteraceae bacterium]HPJ68289.1 uroporphyrinogen-III C-methyltransferase [Desulfobacteraceae bacterium]
MTDNRKGKVYLVGAGPGDPDLITVKGRECIGLADVIIHDYLANRVFLEYADKKAEMIYAGKRGGCHTFNQAEINSLIIDRAEKGLTVVRLKGGDPFIFGRGGEEAQELVRAGISFEVVPGITSAIAVPAYAGIPLTHRDYTSTVAFITGREGQSKEKSSIKWDKISTGVGTLVFLMGVENLHRITENLLKNGRSPDTPVAIICRGTISEQRTLVGRLNDISMLAVERGIKPPAVIIVGEVVNLRNELDWFEKRPLFGKRIIVTRAREQASGFLKVLNSLGAECIEFPTIRIVPPESWAALDRAIAELETYQWLLFSSVNGVKYFIERMKFHGKDVRDLKGIKIGAIGPKTAEVWNNMGISPDLIPDEYRAEALVECFKKLEVKHARILFPRAALAREILPEELRNMGAEVDVVEAYRTVRPESGIGRVKEMLSTGSVDVVTFTSSSTVINFVEMFRPEGEKFLEWMESVTVACIGPITANTAQENGLSVSLVAPEYTVDGLAKTILERFSCR